MDVMAIETTAAEQSERRLPGRPREFDRKDALRSAMLVFWRYGYDGASLTLLTEAMGVSKPTLYAAFGDKIGLFREAVTAYNALKAEEYLAAFALPTARAVSETLLRLTSGVTVLPDTPAGCLLLQGSLLAGPESEALRAEMVALVLAATARLKERYEQAHRDGDLRGDVDAGTLAEYVAALGAGMAVQSSYGVGPDVLNRVVDLAMESWPWDGRGAGQGKGL